MIEKRVELLFTCEQSNRMRESLGHSESFADGFPILLISSGSLTELNRRTSEVHTMERLSISVKRVHGGEVSNWLFNHLQVGYTIIADQPKDTFHITKESNEPLLLLSAGSGYSIHGRAPCARKATRQCDCNYCP